VRLPVKSVDAFDASSDLSVTGLSKLSLLKISGGGSSPAPAWPSQSQIAQARHVKTAALRLLRCPVFGRMDGHLLEVWLDGRRKPKSKSLISLPVWIGAWSAPKDERTSATAGPMLMPAL